MMKGTTCMGYFCVKSITNDAHEKKNILEENKSLPFHKESCSPPKRVVYIVVLFKFGYNLIKLIKKICWSLFLKKIV